MKRLGTPQILDLDRKNQTTISLPNHNGKENISPAMRPSTLTLSLRRQLLRIRPTDPTPRTVPEPGYQGPIPFAFPKGPEPAH
ncbi:hypothetical protein AHAS_Ahas14G0138800 [Arachis hypogaea]